jgi:uncharacterized protein YndB with AHSA1/START domain
MLYVQHDSSGIAGTLPEEWRRASLDIFASVEIDAEVRRVMYALAIPEYMEAWLQLPEADRIECHSDRGSFDKFRIDFFSAGVWQGRINGSCLLSKPNRITYVWERAQAGSGGKSMVEIHLWGNLNCTLKLKHSGLGNRTESEWHSTMWQRSLDKLCGLMAGVGIAV